MVPQSKLPLPTVAPGEGHIVNHSQKERRYQCKRCRRTFSETKDTTLYRIHKPRWLLEAERTA